MFIVLPCSLVFLTQVYIEVNGEDIPLRMKLGENGEAFFVEETDETEVIKENIWDLGDSDYYRLCSSLHANAV